jgi:parallel beta-helix repeat protein
VSGSASAPITVTAAAGAVVTVKGQFKITGSYVRVVGLHFVGPAPDSSSTLIWISGGSHVEVWDSELAGSYSRSALFVDGSASGFYVADNYFHDNGIFDQTYDPLNGQRNDNLDHHIYVASASGGVIANNLMLNARAFGIQLYPGPVSNVIVSGNTIDKTGQAGIIVDNVSNCRITGNILTGSGQVSGGVRAALEVFGKVGAGNYVTNNVSDAGIYNDPGTIPTGTNKFNTSPGYAGGGSYQLQSSSPAVDFAEPAYTLSPDYTGTTRDSAPDAGAYESY